jgi:hypothetical protein
MPFELLLGNRSVPPVVLLMSCELFLGNRSVPPVVLSFPFDIRSQQSVLILALEEYEVLK